MSETFTPSEYSEGYPPGIEGHFWHMARHDFLDRLLKKVLQPGQLALDVGCGAGVYVAHARRRGINLKGVEKGAAPVPAAMQAHVTTNTALADLPMATREHVKVALLLDVIEHIEDRHNFLCGIHSLLPNCDYLVVTVPARREIRSNFDDYWGHHLRYDRPGLNGELKRAGFRPQSNSYYFNGLYLASLLMKFLGMQRATVFRSPRRNIAVRILHRILGSITIVENRIMPGWLPGSTILCLARREAGPATANHLAGKSV